MKPFSKIIQYSSTAMFFGVLFSAHLLFSVACFATATGDYQTHQTGNWNSTSTWERWNGSAWINPAPSTPTSADGVITILNGHTVTLTAAVTADQLTIASGGSLTVNSGITLTIAKTTAPDLVINGTLDIAGGLTINQNTSATLAGLCTLESTGTLTAGGSNSAVAISSGGRFIRKGGTMPTSSSFWGTIYGIFEHGCDLSTSNTLPTATWGTGSTCLISGASLYIPAGMNQSFYNFTWNSTSQTGNLDFGQSLQNVTNDLTVTSTGTGSIYFDYQGQNNTIAIGGSLYIQGGTTYFDVNGNSTVTVGSNVSVTGGALNFNSFGGTAYGSSATTMTINGNLTVSGGTLDESAVTASNVGKGIGIIYLKGNLTVSGSGLITESGYSKGQIYFEGTSTQYFISNNNITNVIDYIIVSGSVVRMDNNIMTGNGAFTLQSGGGVMLGSPQGITLTSVSGNVQCMGTKISISSLYTSGTVMRSYSTGADYTYNATAFQVSGDGLPSQVRNLTLDNISNCVLTASTSASGTIYFVNGIWITRANGVDLAADDTLTLGTSTSVLGTLSRTTSSITTGYVYGYFARWLATTTVPDLIFPVGSMSYYNACEMHYTAATNAGGRIVVSFVVDSAGTSGLPVTDAGDVCQYVAYGYWTSGVKNGYNNSGTRTVTVYGNGTPNISDYTRIHMFNKTGTGVSWSAAGLNGTHMTGTGSNTSPIAGRTGMSGSASFGVYAIVSPSVNPLPITLVEFNAKAEDQQVNVSWQTASEINNDHFTIERSSDGFNFELVRKVKGAGNSTEGLLYSIVDAHPFSGVSYYRLSQTDYDGTTTVFSPVAVEIKRILIYPNPVVDGMNLLVYSNDKMAAVEIYDAAGQQVLSQTEALKSGQNTLSLNLSSLTHGMYVLKIRTSEGTSYERFLK